MNYIDKIKKNGVIYMRVQDPGTVQATKFYEGKEFTLEEINKMAEESEG